MIKPPLPLLFLFGLLATASAYEGVVTAADIPNSIPGIAERELARRNADLVRAKEIIAEGDKAMLAKEYDLAVQQYRAAIDKVGPDSVANHSLRSAAVERFCDASVKLAQERIAQGRYAEAEKILKETLQPAYNPKCSAALTVLRQLQDKEYFNQTITPKFHADIEQVKAWFIEAQGFYDSGRFEKAMQRYDMILGIDPTNVAAREGQIRVDKARNEYADRAYEEARARHLWKVAKGWEIAPRKYDSSQSKKSRVLGFEQDPSSTVRLQKKLATIIIPKVEFKDATLREAIDYLRKRGNELDTDPAKKPINIVLQLNAPSGAASAPAPGATGPAADPSAPPIPGLDPSAAAPAASAVIPVAPTASTTNPSDTPITLTLNNVPMGEALRYIANLAGLKVKYEEHAVNLIPVGVDTLITKKYTLPPGAFIAQGNSAGSTTPAAAAPAGGGATPGAGLGTSSATTANRVPAKDALTGWGVQFPPGAIANFFSNGTLIVKNTQEQLDLIDELVEVMNKEQGSSGPPQVDVETKFVEITQTNLKELSFDWNVGQFNFGSGKRFLGSGGTTGDGTQNKTADYPILDPVTGKPVGTNTLTAGNRTGSGNGGAISRSAIDSLLFPVAAGSTSAAPAILSAASVLSDPNFQVVMRAINQKKGVDLLCAPRVTVKNDTDAKIEIVREFIYPQTYTAPQISRQASDGGGYYDANNRFITSPSAPVVTPTTPSAFTMQPTGVSLKVHPNIDMAGRTIEMQLKPEVIEFDGFINYGSPIMTAQTQTTSVGFVSTSQAVNVVLTENVINQPIFSKRFLETYVVLKDTETVMLGGLMREDVQKVEDKVPFFGDIPLVGRLFRSSVDQHQKRNLVIFVTARLVDATGNLVFVPDEDKEDVVDGAATTALPLPLETSLAPVMPSR